MSPHIVLGLVADEAGNPVVLLAPVEHPAVVELLVPVWMGAQEAALISVALSGRRSSRPLTHDLLQTVIRRFGGAVERCELRLVEREVFATILTVRSWADPIRLDCRPADGIALAVRAGVPIHVPADVVDRCGVVLEHLGDVEAPSTTAFRRFLERVEPEDFARSDGDDR